MLLVKLMCFILQHKKKAMYTYRLFRRFEQASEFCYKSMRSRLKRRCRRRLGDRCEHGLELGRDLDIPDVRIRTVLVLHHDGILRDSASIASGDGLDDWVHSFWSSSSSQVGVVCEGIDKRSV